MATALRDTKAAAKAAGRCKDIGIVDTCLDTMRTLLGHYDNSRVFIGSWC